MCLLKFSVDIDLIYDDRLIQQQSVVSVFLTPSHHSFDLNHVHCLYI